MKIIGLLYLFTLMYLFNIHVYGICQFYRRILRYRNPSVDSQSDKEYNKYQNILGHFGEHDWKETKNLYHELDFKKINSIECLEKESVFSPAPQIKDAFLLATDQELLEETEKEIPEQIKEEAEQEITEKPIKIYFKKITFNNFFKGYIPNETEFLQWKKDYMNALKRYRANRIYNYLLIEFCNLLEEQYYLKPIEAKETLPGITYKIKSGNYDKKDLVEKTDLPREWIAVYFDGNMQTNIINNPFLYNENSNPNGLTCLNYPKTGQRIDQKLTWVTFGTDDPTSDFDFSINIEKLEGDILTDKEVSVGDCVGEGECLQKHLSQIEEINNIFMKVTTRFATKFRRVRDYNRKMEDIIDSNGYPEIMHFYNKYYKKDPISESADLTYLASLEFNVCTGANILIIDWINKRKEIPDI